MVMQACFPVTVSGQNKPKHFALAFYSRPTRQKELLCCAGAGVVYLFWQRPRFAKITGTIAAVVLVPYLAFTTPVIRKYQNFAANVVKAAEQAQHDGHTDFRN